MQSHATADAIIRNTRAITFHSWWDIWKRCGLPILWQ